MCFDIPKTFDNSFAEIKSTQTLIRTCISNIVVTSSIAYISETFSTLIRINSKIR